MRKCWRCKGPSKDGLCGPCFYALEAAQNDRSIDQLKDDQQKADRAAERRAELAMENRAGGFNDV